MNFEDEDEEAVVMRGSSDVRRVGELSAEDVTRVEVVEWEDLEEELEADRWRWKSELATGQDGKEASRFIGGRENLFLSLVGWSEGGIGLEARVEAGESDWVRLYDMFGGGRGAAREGLDGCVILYLTRG